MNIRSFCFFAALAALAMTGFVFHAPLSAHTSADAHDTLPTTVVCDDESIPQGVTWSVKVEVHAVRNDTGKELPRDPSADITKWDLRCLKHSDVAHHKGDEVHTGVCLKGGECETGEGDQQATVRTPGSYHCHVINGSVICHEY